MPDKNQPIENNKPNNISVTTAQPSTPADISLCANCQAMTHDIPSDTKGDETYCGKCGRLKPSAVDEVEQLGSK